jgi:hypothetical protein
MATRLHAQVQRGYVLEIAVEAEEEGGFQLRQGKRPPYSSLALTFSKDPPASSK